MPKTGNPFTVQTPEDMPAEEAFDLFVDVFTDFPKVPHVGHLFLNGPRGSGKSMIFRFLMPDCQALKHGVKDLRTLPFYSVYVPVKSWFFQMPGLKHPNERDASVLFNEHLMVMFIASRVLADLSVSDLLPEDQDSCDACATYVDEFQRLLEMSGLTRELGLESWSSPRECFGVLKTVTESLYNEVVQYVSRIALPPQAIEPYTGPLCSYMGFLLPLLDHLRALPFMVGRDKPIFMLVDDADHLSLTQTQILNGWVATRTSKIVSIKVSTQFQYKTITTIAGHTIDTPHDYSEINISTQYTTRRGNYLKRIREITAKRLNRVGIDLSPEDFFPPDEAQEQRIKAIAAEYIRRWETEGRGNRPADDAYRYARPDFIRALGGTAKSTYTYSYAGFEQLVHVSSAIVRHFLDAAAHMYGVQESQSRERPISKIPPSVQNNVVRELADAFLFDEMDKLSSDAAPQGADEETVTYLGRLISVLGGVFRMILRSDRAERRVFSIAFSDQPTERLRKTLRLGQVCGYFHVASVGNKEGTGRTRLYIMSRRLAPVFNLDPTGFQGYLFFVGEALDKALDDPKGFLRDMERRITTRQDADAVFEERQLKLFDGESIA